MYDSSDESDQPAESEALGLNDRDLLPRFIWDSDEAAFAEVVRWYYGLAMSVCRRGTESAADAKEACQAAFLGLARRSRPIGSSRCLAGSNGRCF